MIRATKHQQVKFKALISLYWRYQAGDMRYLTASELSIISDCDYRSLLVLLPKWVRWHYLSRRMSGSGVYVYSPRLLPKGYRFLESHSIYRPFETRQFIDELTEYRREINYYRRKLDNPEI